MGREKWVGKAIFCLISWFSSKFKNPGRLSGLQFISLFLELASYHSESLNVSLNFLLAAMRCSPCTACGGVCNSTPPPNATVTAGANSCKVTPSLKYSRARTEPVSNEAKSLLLLQSIPGAGILTPTPNPNFPCWKTEGAEFRSISGKISGTVETWADK